MKLLFNTSIGLRKSQCYSILFILLSSWTGQAQQLEVYIQEAIKNNPTIRAVETKHAISIEKISETTTLPNTDFSGGYMIGKDDMPMMQQAEFSVMQMLPWFGTISARSNYATAMADADLLEIEITKKEIDRDLSQSYYRLAEISEKQKVLSANVELLEVYEQMALTSIEVGKTSAVSLLQLQMRKNNLIERKLVLEQDYLSELTIFNKTMNRKDNLDVLILDSLKMPENDKTISFSDLNFHPEMTRFEELHNIVTQANTLNKKESAPQLGVGLEYMLYNEAPDMLMPMVSISIPIFNKKYKSITKQNKLRQEELSIQKQATENILLAALETAIRSRNAARIRLETQNKNLKQAKNATEILFKNYETGTIDFREVLDIQELQLQFQINRIEAIGEYFKQTSIIDYFVARK